MATVTKPGKSFLDDFATGRQLKVKPISDHILVEREGAEDKSKGGIFIPQQAQEKPQLGKVIAVGPGNMNKEGERVALQVKEGDTVLFTKWAGNEIKELGEGRILIREVDVLAVLDSE